MPRPPPPPTPLTMTEGTGAQRRPEGDSASARSATGVPASTGTSAARRQRPGFHFVAKTAKHAGGRPDEDDAGVRGRLPQMRLAR